VSVLAWVLAADLIARAIRARQETLAQAAYGLRQAERYLAWTQRYGTPEQIQDAQQVADAWRDYRDSLS
jgi:hypothetical protein